jgi:phage repressor protein C with HTH and peptisase S24 domain
MFSGSLEPASWYDAGVWADKYIERLDLGETVQFRPRGNSMEPRIKSGQLVTVDPLMTRDFKVGDIVLCTVDGKQYVHLVKQIAEAPSGMRRTLIGNNHGKINGWASDVYGVVINVED